MSFEVFRMPLYYPLSPDNEMKVKRMGRLLTYGSGLLSKQMSSSYAPSLVQAIQKFEDTAKDYESVDWDLHEKNVMEDGEGNIVFIDPIRQLDQFDESWSEEDWE